LTVFDKTIPEGTRALDVRVSRRPRRTTNSVTRDDPDAPLSPDTLTEGSVNMDHIGKFEVLIREMKADGRYRTFVELERMAGEFPAALCVAASAGAAASPCGAATTISEWGSILMC
jgi:hypothetical protein